MDGGIGSRYGITEFHGKSGDGTANGDGLFTEPKRITAGAGVATLPPTNAWLLC